MQKLYHSYIGSSSYIALSVMTTFWTISSVLRHINAASTITNSAGSTIRRGVSKIKWYNHSLWSTSLAKPSIASKLSILAPKMAVATLSKILSTVLGINKIVSKALVPSFLISQRPICALFMINRSRRKYVVRSIVGLPSKSNFPSDDSTFANRSAALLLPKSKRWLISSIKLDSHKMMLLIK